MVEKRKRKPARAPLSRERIAEEALAMIDRDGLEALSARRLGAALGCEAMSIYHHFPSRSDLLDGVAARLVAEAEVPPYEAGNWIERMRGVAISYFAVAQRHPRAFVVLSARRFNTPRAVDYLESVLSIFRGAGFSARESVEMFRILGYFLNGASLAELTLRRQEPDAAARLMMTDRDALASWKHVVEAQPYLGPEYSQKPFDAGLELILRGFAARKPSRGTKSKRTK